MIWPFQSAHACAEGCLRLSCACRVWMIYMLFGLFISGAAVAHDFRVGPIVLDHPYATPSLTQTGAVYFRALRNHGESPDRLLSASTPVAARVSFHAMKMDGDVMRMREVSAIDLLPMAEVRMTHGLPNGHHLMLEGLRFQLKDGDRFDLTLRFEKAGERTVQIWVQSPRNRAVRAHH